MAEAPGADEEQAGEGLVGKSGYALFQHLKRVDIDRDGFTIFNVVACRPPDNKLVTIAAAQAQKAADYILNRLIAEPSKS